MEVRETRIGDFLDELASAKPTPGSGCVAGLCGALGAALVSMVAGLTAGRERYAGVDEKMCKILESAKTMLGTFSKLAEDDMVVYEEFMTALGMPKSTDEEHDVRKRALSTRSKLIVSIPLDIAEQSIALGALALDALEHGNPNASMDAAAAVQLALATAKIASNDVRFNLRYIEDAKFARTVGERLELVMKDIAGIAAASETFFKDLLKS